jgi:hypothetical protein
MLAGYVKTGMDCSSCPVRSSGAGCASCRVKSYYGVGDETTDALLAPLTAAVLPQLKAIVAQSAEASEPMIRRIVVEDVLPKFGMAVVLGMLVGGIAAAAIGSWFATRRR